jgi:hypothetical protein
MMIDQGAQAKACAIVRFKASLRTVGLTFVSPFDAFTKSAADSTLFAVFVIDDPALIID